MSEKIDLKFGADGKRYRVSAPDTLDLAERARLSVNNLTGMIDKNNNFEPYHTADFTSDPPYMNHMTGGCCTPKVMESLLMTRLMSGSEQDIAAETGMWEWVLDSIDENGLWWLKSEGRPWQEFYGGDCVCTCMSARMIIVFLQKYKLDKNPEWIKTVRRMINGLLGIMIEKDGGLHFQDDLYYRDGWRTSGDGWGTSPFRGQQIRTYGEFTRALMLLHDITGDKSVFITAEKLMKTMIDLNPGFWTPANDAGMIAGTERAHWEGHHHTHFAAAWGALEYAVSANDAKIKRWCRDFYEYSRFFGIPRLGYFPAVIGDHGNHILAVVGHSLDEFGLTENDTDTYTSQPSESCSTADAICFAVRLSDSGIGDYWDDADQYIRNNLAEMQLTELSQIKALASDEKHELDPSMITTENVAERNVGAFTSISDPGASYGYWTICCIGNCNTALYKAWEAITRIDNNTKTAVVNLLLNRVSEWLDIDSYLPYQGKAVIKNKTAKRIHVRIPVWADKNSVKVAINGINGKETAKIWSGNYLIIENTAANDIITIEFPMVTTVEYYTEKTYRTKFKLTMKGNTLADISPRSKAPSRLRQMGDDGLWHPFKKFRRIYQRDCLINPVIEIERERFVPADLI